MKSSLNVRIIIYEWFITLAAICLMFFEISASADVPFRGFTDFSYVYDATNSANYFQIRDLDIFVSGQLDKRVSYTAEINFQPSFNGVGVDLERTFVQYQVSPWFKVAVGRFHTALGYWNDTYHHGSYLATSATRPVMERFEDAGGLLPVHNTGIEIRGNGLVGSGNFGYIFNIGNGRGPRKDPPTSFFSYNKSKSVSGVVFYELSNGIRVGANFWRSDLPGGYALDGDSTNTASSGPKGTEYIAGFHFIYNSPSIEWLSEYHHMYHSYVGGTDSWNIVNQNADGSTQTHIDLMYAQLGLHFGLFTPYVRYEINATSTNDVYLNSGSPTVQGLPATTRNYVLGTRYELSSISALKAEYTFVSSGAPVFISNFSNQNPPTSLTNQSIQVNWSLAW